MPIFQRIYIPLLLIISLAGCASLPSKTDDLATAYVLPTKGQLSALVDAARPVQTSAEMSAVLMLESGWSALAQRLALVETAQHSIDIQYYIWNSDVSGRYLASRLIAAADRGVHVRVMLDDINLNQRDGLLLALDAHPQIEIQIFNPVPSRNGIAKWLNILSDFSRLNRRMHNKSFTVDGTLAIIGGRNIGDEYFDLSEQINFRDRDVLVSGAVVSDIKKSFTQYWRSDWSYPIQLLAEKRSIDLALLTNAPVPLYQHYPALPTDSAGAQQQLSAALNDIAWVSAQFIADHPIPANVDDVDTPKATARLLAKLAKQTEQQILLESAYLIVDDSQLALLQTLNANQVEIKALTNSMASNDLLTNHSGYAGRRLDMLEQGIQLFELKPEAQLCLASTQDPSKCAPTVPYGLHAKSIVFDQRIACIGSFNVNLRSTYLNTESLLIIHDQAVAQALATKMAKAMDEHNSWQLKLVNGKIRWYSGSQSWNKEPQSSQWERIKSTLLQLLPIEKYL